MKKIVNITIVFCILILAAVNTMTFASSNNYYILDEKLSLEKQLLYSDATYEFRSTIKLNSDFTVPDNCTLLFVGGGIEGSHKLYGANTQIRAGDYDVIFKDVVCLGKWHCDKASICWWGARDSYKIAPNGKGSLADVTCDNAIELCMQSSFPAVFFPIGCWYITKTIEVTMHKDFILAGGPAVKSYYLNDLVYNNNVQEAILYTDRNIKVFRICFNGEEVINFHGGSIDVSRVYLKNKNIYNESVFYFDISEGCMIMQGLIETHMINYQDEKTFFENDSRGVFFNVSGSKYSFATDVTIACKINGFATGIETCKEEDANKSSWITGLIIDSSIRKARTAIKLPEGDGTVIRGSLQSTRFFDDNGGKKDKDRFPFVDIGCRFVQITASIWDVNSKKKDKWSNGIAVRVQEEKRTCEISEAIVSQYGAKKALVLPK